MIVCSTSAGALVVVSMARHGRPRRACPSSRVDAEFFAVSLERGVDIDLSVVGHARIAFERYEEEGPGHQFLMMEK